MKEDSFALEVRRTIYNFILNNPGSHLRKISRATDIQLGTLRYHLDYLEKKELVISKKEKNLKLYFIPGRLSSGDINITSLLQQQRFREIILMIVITPGMTHKEISDELEIKPSTLSKYIKLLEEKKIIYHVKDGRERHYHVPDDREIMELLLTYKRSFWDSLVDNVLKIYFER